MRSTDALGNTATFGYDALGDVISETFADGAQNTFTDNSQGRLLTASANGAVTSYTYTGSGALSSVTDPNGKTIFYAYDDAGRTMAIVNRKADGQTVSFDNYVYNANSQIVSDTSQNGYWTYSYDGIGELTGANFLSATAALPNSSISYVYDAAGIRVSETVNGVTTAFATNAMNQTIAAGGVTYAFNASGQITSRTDASGSTAYSYNNLGLLASANGPSGSLQYGYDALGNLVSQTKDGVTTNFVRNPLALTLADAPLSAVAEAYEAGGSTTDYVYGLRLAAAIDGAGQASYYTLDLAGNVTGLTTASGALAEAYAYDPFGQATQLTGATGGLLQFSGGYGIVASGRLNLTQARAYDPALGRFISADPFGQIASPNLYAYVGNNPVSRIDPSGLGYVSAGVSGGAGIVLGIAIQIDDAGNVYIQPQFGVGLPGGSLNFTASNGSACGYGQSVQVGATSPYGIGVTTQANVSLDSNGNRVYSNESGVVVGAPGPSGSYTMSHSYPVYTIPNPTNDSPPPIKPNNNAANAYDAFSGSGNLTDNGNGTLGSYAFGHTEFVTPHDPNGIVGPAAFVPENFVSAQNPLAFTIDFENAATASAPAQTITITEQLDASFDWRTFRLTGFGFDNQSYSIGDVAYFSEILDLRATKGYEVAVAAGVNVITGVATWIFQTLDPATGLTPLDPKLGLLPVNDANHSGDGSVSYTIRAKAGVAAGTVVNWQAKIVFDTEPPIDTPVIFDTLDPTAPTSAVPTLPAHAASATFEVSWSGADDPSGSGSRELYDLRL